MRKIEINTTTNLPICPKCNSEMRYVEIGGYHIDRGELWDDIETALVCRECGYFAKLSDCKLESRKK